MQRFAFEIKKNKINLNLTNRIFSFWVFVRYGPVEFDLILIIRMTVYVKALQSDCCSRLVSVSLFFIIRLISLSNSLVECR